MRELNMVEEPLISIDSNRHKLQLAEKSELFHFAFLYEIKMWLGANRIAETISATEPLTIPLNKNIADGITESAIARNTLFFLKQTIHTAQYSRTSALSTIKYSSNNSSKHKQSSEHHPNHVPGMLTIIKAKHPNLPICSMISTHLFFHLFSKPSLHLTANTMFGIIMTAIKISPKMLIYSIVSSAKRVDYISSH